MRFILQDDNWCAGIKRESEFCCNTTCTQSKLKLRSWVTAMGKITQILMYHNSFFSVWSTNITDLERAFEDFLKETHFPNFT